MALPGRFAVPVRVRRRACALLFTAARISGETAGPVFGGGHPAGVSDQEGLCTVVHDFLCAPDLVCGFLARSADHRKYGPGRNLASCSDKVVRVSPTQRAIGLALCIIVHAGAQLLDVKNAVIVLPEGATMPQRKATVMLAEEIEKRTQLRPKPV